MVKCLAQGHKCSYRESNPHSGFLTTPELESGALDRSATTLWEEGKVQNNWKRSLIVKLPKKGDLKECKNWRGITLPRVISKVISRIVITRIRTGVDNRLRKEQAGFRKGRGIIEQIFILKNIIEQANEWQATLYLNFVDFEKAFDSIHMESL